MPGQQETAANATIRMRMQHQQELIATVCAWMDGIPPEDELMDPNLDGTGGVGDATREWVRTVTPSAESATTRPRSSTAVGEGDGGDGFEENLAVEEGVQGGGNELLLKTHKALAERISSFRRTVQQQPQQLDTERAPEPIGIRQSGTTTAAENTQYPPESSEGRMRMAEKNEAIRKIVEENAIPSVGFPTPPPLPPPPLSPYHGFPQPYPEPPLSTDPCISPKKDKPERRSFWKRVTRYSAAL
ncbi:hypothetical protein L873DRAFT_1811948 [Choiromyces venosus 120613-1]|uniref:Uncharacterized protein n=1 Tax=Choiromyces venosus 120613-1 TaxID=1336337 RepID=A0A3N4JCU4_9PEZI|nr:hypothetical protein L873DRAFT_1811948 [Choiromyces venosus 120613-1]